MCVAHRVARPVGWPARARRTGSSPATRSPAASTAAGCQESITLGTATETLVQPPNAARQTPGGYLIDLMRYTLIAPMNVNTPANANSTR